jgi:peptidoglycan/LPS O-acetylase OafA/YrhL
VRRVFRIYPLAIAIVILTASLQLAANSPVDTRQLLSNIFLVHNLTGNQPYIGPLWSLPYEVQMYLVLPAIYVVVTRTRRPLFWCAILYIASVATATLDSVNVGDFHVPGTSPSLLRFAPCFVSGALAFALIGRIQPVLSPLALVVIIGLGIAAVPWLVTIGLPETQLMWAFCLMLGCAIPACRELTFQPLASVFKTTATYSYGVYLTHIFALTAVTGLMPGPVIVQWVSMLILLYGLAYICYHGIEKHGVALGARLAMKISDRQNLRAAARSNQASGL